MHRLLVAAALAALAAAGCSSPSPTPAVLLVDSHVLASGDPEPNLAEGEHCVVTEWVDPVLRMGRPFAGRDLVVLHTYHGSEFKRGLPRYGGGDESLAWTRVLLPGESMALHGSFDPRPLRFLTWDGAAAYVDGSPADGQSYEATSPVAGGTWHETLTLTLRTDIDVRSFTPGPCD